jgi:hypothetical protein
MKLQSKRRILPVDSGEAMVTLDPEDPKDTIFISDQYDKSQRLKLAKEKFLRRKAEYYIKKKLMKTSEKLQRYQQLKANIRNEDIKF